MLVQDISKSDQLLIDQINNFRKLNPDGIVIGTHPGNFHPDETCSVAALKIQYPNALIIRSRNFAVLALCTFRVDVGGKDNAETGDFDHHQEGGAGKRVNGIHYSSFGLVWVKYGAQIAGDARIARFIDKILVQSIDAADNGQILTESKAEYHDAKPYSLAQAISILNPCWDEDAEADSCFMEAVALAKMVIRRIIEQTRATNSAQPFVKKAVASATDPRIIILSRACPWKNVIMKQAPEARFVVFPNDNGTWCVQGIPVAFGTFELRQDLPAHWAKINGRSFAEITGVKDADFIHQKLFLCTARSSEGALELARLALQSTPAKSTSVDDFKNKFGQNPKG